MKPHPDTTIDTIPSRCPECRANRLLPCSSINKIVSYASCQHSRDSSFCALRISSSILFLSEMSLFRHHSPINCPSFKFPMKVISNRLTFLSAPVAFASREKAYNPFESIFHIKSGVLRLFGEKPTEWETYAQMPHLAESTGLRKFVHFSTNRPHSKIVSKHCSRGRTLDNDRTSSNSAIPMGKISTNFMYF